MATELIKRSIDGIEYGFQQLGAKQSLKVLLRLKRVVQGSVSMLLSSFEPSETSISLFDRNINTDFIGKAIEALADKIDDDEVIDLIETLTAKDNVLWDGKKIIFNTHYEGRLEHLFKVLGAALEVQYGNFFDAFSALQSVRKSPLTNSAPQT